VNRYQFLVMTRAETGTDEEFNRWYDRQHLADVLAVPGFVSARRFKVLTAATLGSGEPPQWQYVAIYEMECEDPQSAVAELMSRADTAQMPISKSLELQSATTFLLQQISEKSGP
jgi:hypothetical protein